MNTLKTLVTGTLIVAMAGCTMPSLPIEQDPISMKAAPGFDKARVKSSTKLTLRTYRQDIESSEKNPNKEVANANCTAKADEFSASFKTPAILTLPVIVKKPSPLVIRCKQNGYAAMETLNPGLPSATVTGGGLLLGLATLAATAAVSATINEWRYTRAAADYGGLNLEKPGAKKKE